ncbi:GDSL-type esterase/lipase family protein [Bordetella trematum]|uniref:GDSL-type esterase/lipase family protein n=1 Tax=Bordetella trematum TaxID=123899 RepID=UPI0009DB7649|nr:GDSL-type esterase/lipase family protein [Bordetella trematum]
MAKYNTGNPLGSKSPKDLSDNAENLDDAVNTPLETWTDRFGKQRLSLAGMSKAAGDASVAIGAAQESVAAAQLAGESSRLAAKESSRAAEEAARATDAAAQALEANRLVIRATYQGLLSALTGPPAEPDETPGQVTNDPDPNLNGNYIFRAGSLVRSELQPASASELQRVWVRFGDSSAAVLVAGERVPLLVDEDGNVPLWLENGLLSGAGLGDSLSAGLARAAGFAGQSRYVPLAIDDESNVPIWLENGLLGAVGLAPGLLAVVDQSLGGSYAPRNAPLASKAPRATDGRTLFLLRAALSRILASASGVARVMIAGDSWAEQTPISQAVADLLYEAYGKAGEGWISVNAGNKLNGVSLVRSGSWTLYNASSLSAGAPAYGCGIDGRSISTTGTDATLKISDLSCTDVTIFYSNQSGAFRWRVDGGPWTTVTGTGDGSIGSVEVSGLSEAAHVIEYDTSVNTAGGVVAIHGHRARFAAAPGAEVFKVGTGGQTGTGMLQIAGQVAPYAQRLQPHVVFLILGTNDYRTGASVADYRAALEMWISEVRSQVPGCGFVFVVPAQSNATPGRPLSVYRDAAYEVAIHNGAEFLSLYDEWGDFSVMDEMGQWGDALHPSKDGGEHIAQSFFHRFLSF